MPNTRAEEMLQRWLDEPSPDDVRDYVALQLSLEDRDADILLNSVVMAGEAGAAKGDSPRLIAGLAFLTGIACARFARELDEEDLTR